MQRIKVTLLIKKDLFVKNLERPLQQLGDFVALVHMKAHKFHLLCSKDQGTAENKHNISLIPKQSLLLDILVPGMH